MSIVDGVEHRALAKTAAARGLTLLKNDQATLPLAHSSRGLGQARSKRRLAVIGPNANRTMTLTSNYAGCKDTPGGPIIAECSFVNPLQGLRAAALASDDWDDEVLFEEGCDIDSNDVSRFSAAIAIARLSDVVIFVGGLITCQEIGPQCQEAEARDRSSPVGEGTDVGKDVGIGLVSTDFRSPSFLSRKYGQNNISHRNASTPYCLQR